MFQNVSRVKFLFAILSFFGKKNVVKKDAPEHFAVHGLYSNVIDDIFWYNYRYLIPDFQRLIKQRKIPR